MRLIFFAFFMCLSLNTATAAIIEVTSVEGGVDVIEIGGDLTLADTETFRSKSAFASKALVVLSSPGGSVLAGIQIGEIIRLKGFSTLVPPKNSCASACALVWLGGVRRFMGEGAKVGFHAAHNATSGEVSGVGNALVGAYLNKIGLPTAAVAYITMASPQTITWLTVADANRYGIDVEILPAKPYTGRKSSAASAPETVKPSIELMAVDFVKMHAAIESEPAELSLRHAAEDYAETVFYYGKIASREAVLAEYAKFVERWPLREYRVRVDETKVNCLDQDNACNVETIIDWVAISEARNSRSTGSSSWNIGLRRQGTSFVIISVNGKVISRNITDLNASSPITNLFGGWKN